jgi:hypothetical protein
MNIQKVTDGGHYNFSCKLNNNDTEILVLCNPDITYIDIVDSKHEVAIQTFSFSKLKDALEYILENYE